ncbi:MAG: hypothetical protein JO258_13165, partial [Alphaproteobacteria bacterium]|nr:hypothetical protein [Alphaproteobacteria bacterium]
MASAAAGPVLFLLPVCARNDLPFGFSHPANALVDLWFQKLIKSAANQPTLHRRPQAGSDNFLNPTARNLPLPQPLILSAFLLDRDDLLFARGCAVFHRLDFEQRLLACGRLGASGRRTSVCQSWPAS